MSGSESGWQAGDLALCIRGGSVTPHHTVKEFPVCGRLYTVTKATTTEFMDGKGGFEALLGLTLKDGPPNSLKSYTWAAHRFVKIPPHKMDKEDEETLSQMLNPPVPQKVKENS